jgi:hypothetical protein
LQELLISVLLAIHLIAINLSCGGPLLCIGLRACSRDDHSHGSMRQMDLARSLAWLSLWALVVGMATGGVLLFLPAFDDYWSAMKRFPASAYWAAGFELLFSVVCLWAYAGLWRRMERWRWVHAIFALLATTNLLYHFPPLMIVLGKLANYPLWATEQVINRQEFLKLMSRGEVLSLTFHFSLASLAVGGVGAIAIFARQDALEPLATHRKFCSRGALVALASTLLQLPVGVWVLLVLSDAERGSLFGANLLASTVFWGGLITALYFLQGLTRIVFSDFCNRDCQRVVWLLFIVVLFMSAALRLSRYKEPQKANGRAEHARSLEVEVPV